MSDLSSPDLAAIQARLDALAFLVRGAEEIKYGAVTVPSRAEALELDALIGADVPDLLEEVARLQARVDVLTDQVAGRDEQIAQLQERLGQMTVARDVFATWNREAEAERNALREEVAGRDATIQRVRDFRDRYAKAPDRDRLGLTMRAVAKELSIALDGDPADDGSQIDG